MAKLPAPWDSVPEEWRTIEPTSPLVPPPPSSTPAPAPGPTPGPVGSPGEPPTSWPTQDPLKDLRAQYPGVPDNVLLVIDQMLRNNSSPEQILAYLRGTTWHKDTYKGFQEGFKFGLFQDEGGYRDYQNQANQFYRNFEGRDASLEELEAWIKAGTSATIIGQNLAGSALAKTQGNDWQYYSGAFGQGRLSQGELDTLGKQNTGLNTSLGFNLQKRIEEAQKRAARLFEGVLASPSLQIGGAGLSAPSLGKKPDVGA